MRHCARESDPVNKIIDNLPFKANAIGLVLFVVCVVAAVLVVRKLPVPAKVKP